MFHFELPEFAYFTANSIIFKKNVSCIKIQILDVLIVPI